ncbi:hypothetical protein [Lactobacillus helveticus]|uniref:hypothetical protein n=1 Tax=Lactobacillus helveticus TaxID=1587 RepID=UPI0015E8D6E1|nr:hypothetical protein [Lactobacillus helveticus]
MSQYNKTVLTNAGLELAKRANAGQAKFEITRAVTSADDWSNKTIQDLEEATAIPNIMQQGTIMDAEEVESNNSVIGVSLCFTNKDLSTSYQIRVIGLYVKEEGQDKDFLYAVTTAVTPEYMPDFNDKVMYRFNMQIYLVIGKAQAVNVVINDGASVTHGQFDKYKSEVTADLEKIENTHKEDMSHVVKSASINDGDEILPDEAGKLKLVVPDPDLSKYVSLEQLGELLKAKADKTDVASLQNTVNNIDSTRTPIVAGTSGDDLFAFKTNQIRLYNGNGSTCKNLPPAENINWFSVQYVFEGPNDNGIAIYRTPHNEIWTVGCNGGSYPFYRESKGWLRVANSTDISSLQNTVNNIDSTRTPIVAGTSGDDLFAFKTNQIRLYNGNGSTCKNLPPAKNINWFSVQYVFEGPNDNGIAIYRTPHNEIWTVGCNGGSYPFYRESKGWLRVANSTDISNLQNTINQQNQTIQSLTTRLTNAENEIRYIKDNYIEGKRFPASQEAQAEAWENEKPTRLAMIEK